jgi:DNA-binding NarL/FixJ family response regulator
MTIKVLLADDHRIVREGLRSCLSKEKSIEVVGEAENGRQAVELAARLRPNVVIMDIGMPDLNGFEATRQIVDSSPNTRVIALSMHAEERHVSEMLRAGASGYLKKDCGFGELIQAVEDVAHGKLYLCQDATGILVHEHLATTPSAKPSGASLLAPREREVLQLLAEGKNTKEIAQTLSVSIKTVETYRARLMDKLKVFTVAELTRYAILADISPLEAGKKQPPDKTK